MNAILVALPLLFGAPIAHGDVTVEAHGGTPQGWGAQQATAAVEVRLTPRLELDVPAEVQSFQIWYAPSLTWRSLDFQPRPYVLHTGSLTWDRKLSQRLDVFGNAHLSAGEETYYRYLGTPEAPAGPGEFIGTTDRMLIAVGQADAGVEWAAGPRERLRLHALYDVSGGLDSFSKSVVPLRNQPSGAAEGELDVTRRVVARLEARFLAPSFSPGPSYRVGVADLAWTRRLTPSAELTPGVGLYSFLGASGTTVDAKVRPQGFLQYEQAFGPLRQVGRFVAKVSYETRLNALDGLADQTANGSLGWSWRFSSRFSAAVQGAASFVLANGGTDGRLLRAGLWSRYTIVPRHLRLEGGASAFTQILPSRLGGYEARAWDLWLGVTGSIETPHGP